MSLPLDVHALTPMKICEDVHTQLGTPSHTHTRRQKQHKRSHTLVDPSIYSHERQAKKHPVSIAAPGDL